MRGIVLRQFQTPARRESWEAWDSLPDIIILLHRYLLPFIHMLSQETGQLIILFKARYSTSAIFSRHPRFSLAIFEITFQDVC